MKNALKRSLTPEELNQLTAQVFGADSEIFKTVELKDGWFNTAYDLLLKNGLHTVLKLAPLTGEGVMRYERNMMQTEVEVLKLLQQIDGIPVPEVYFAGKDPQGGECFLMKFISGLPLDKAKMQLTEPEMQAVRYELGTISQRINEIEGEQFGYFATDHFAGLYADDHYVYFVLYRGELEHVFSGGFISERYEQLSAPGVFAPSADCESVRAWPLGNRFRLPLYGGRKACCHPLGRIASDCGVSVHAEALQ